MRRLTRPPRIVTLCVRGATARLQDNADRISLLPEIVRALLELPDWHPIGAVVLPGGFFRMAQALGATTFAQRRALVRSEKFAIAARAAVGLLEGQSPGIRLVTGVLATPRDPTERTEQLSLAFSAHGLVGAARKIFPTAGDTEGRRFITPYIGDYSSPQRLFKLANGSTAILNACYDLFGLADVGTEGTSRRNAIRRLLTRDGSLSQDDEGFPETRRACLAAWAKLIGEHQPDVALATIHGFIRPGIDGYWQRHGIARASAAHNGALVAAGAHFRIGLPEHSASTLAACNVPVSHIDAGLERRAHPLLPIASQLIEGPDGLQGLLRLFTPLQARHARPSGGSR